MHVKEGWAAWKFIAMRVAVVRFRNRRSRRKVKDLVRDWPYWRKNVAIASRLLFNAIDGLPAHGLPRRVRKLTAISKIVCESRETA